MTTEQLLDVNSKTGYVKVLKNLETQNLIKNTFISELKDVFNNAYDKENNLTNSGTERLIKYLTENIDGLTQNSFELSDTNYTLNKVCDAIEQNF